MVILLSLNTVLITILLASRFQGTTNWGSEPTGDTNELHKGHGHLSKRLSSFNHEKIRVLTGKVFPDGVLKHTERPEYLPYEFP
jgi:hypothetical protein